MREGVGGGRPVLWLFGVRRVGKTCLCQSLRNIEYFDCELPRVRRMLEDPQEFWARLAGRRVVVDEVHRLPNPSELLKVAADHFPGVRVLATGSSTLGASARFRDTLTGRKRDVRLTSHGRANRVASKMPPLCAIRSSRKRWNDCRRSRRNSSWISLAQYASIHSWKSRSGTVRARKKGGRPP